MSEKRVIIVSIFLFALIIVALVYDKYKPRNTQWATITNAQKTLLTSGDIIFTEGHSFKSDLVRLGSGVKDGQHFSHCGFITTHQDDIYVVHMSIDKGVIVKEPIDSFWDNNKVNSYSICRVEGVYSSEQIESELNDLLLDNVRFDNSYNAMDGEELYCTELICSVFNKVSEVNLYPFEDLRKYIYPNNLYQIPILIKIL